MEKEKNDKDKKLTDYSADEKYNRRGAIITALLKWLECDFFGVFIFLSLFALTLVLGNAGNFIFGTLGLICYICVLADFGLKEGGKAHIKNTLRGDNVSRNFGLLLGLVSGIPALISYILLLLSYFKVTGSAVLLFKVMNSGLWGYINLFVKDMNIENMSSTLLIIYPLTMLIYPITVNFTFKMGYDNEDFQTKIVYKKQS